MVNEMTQYTVPDLLHPFDKLRIVLLLESPYGSEVVHQHPLAGDSGKSVTKLLVNEISEEFAKWELEVPFGCHLKSRDYAKIGLMNCSLLPLDKSVYSCSRPSGDTATILGMDSIRRNPKSKTRRDLKYTIIENKIIADLTLRLSQLPNSVLIVPCGQVARTMVSKTQTSLAIYGGEVPHPSRNQWSRKANLSAIQALVSALRERLSGKPRSLQPAKRKTVQPQ